MDSPKTKIRGALVRRSQRPWLHRATVSKHEIKKNWKPTQPPNKPLQHKEDTWRSGTMAKRQHEEAFDLDDAMEDAVQGALVCTSPWGEISSAPPHAAAPSQPAAASSAPSDMPIVWGENDESAALHAAGVLGANVQVTVAPPRAFGSSVVVGLIPRSVQQQQQNRVHIVGNPRTRHSPDDTHPQAPLQQARRPAQPVQIVESLFF